MIRYRKEGTMNYAFAERYNGITGSAIRQIFALLTDPQIISFAGGNPSPAAFPGEKLSLIARDLLSREGSTVLQYGGTVGEPVLRGEMTKMLQAEGFDPDPQELIILSGASQGIELMTKAFIEKGDVVLTESPTFLGALQTFYLYQARVEGVPMDEEGMDMNALEDKIKASHPKFIYTIPTFQNPTGRTMPEARRKEMAALAARYGVMILEDDPYNLLRYRGTPQKSIQSFDKEGCVLRLMSFSKTVSPGLRVGAAYGPREIIHKFNLGKQGQDLHTSNLSQRLVSEYIRRGWFEEGVAHNCSLYKDKLALMHKLCEEYFPQGSLITDPDGGMFLWVELPEKLDAEALFPLAVERKVAYVPGTHFYPDLSHKNTLRLNYTMASEEQIEKGMKILGDLFREQLKK